MPTIDFTSGYRDATQGSTLKALAQRRAEMAANLAARKTPQINDPWQGAAEVANTISGSIREGRLASQEAAGRQRFAQLLSGGLAPDEIGEAMGLDPETTQMYVKHGWEQQATADERKYTEGRDLLQHGWDVDKQVAEIKARQDLQAQQEAAQRTLASDRATVEEKQAAQLVLTNTAAKQQQSNLNITEAQKAAEITAGQPQTTEAKLAADLKAGRIDQATYDAGIKKETNIPPPASLNQDRAALWKQQDEYTTTTATIGQLNEAKDLLKQGINWGRFEGPLWTQAGASGFGSKEDKQQAQRTLRYNTIMGGNALTSLAATLKGASSDKDVAVFMDIMNNPAMDPNTKAKAIDDIMVKVSSNMELQRQRIKDLGGDLPAEAVKPKDDEKAASLDNARKAIAANPAIAEMVKKRLVENGIDPSEL